VRRGRDAAALNGGELPSDAALYWLMADVVDKLWDKTYAIEGGNDQLPAKFTEALADHVRYTSVVTEIAQDDNGVTVTYMNAGVKKTVAGDLCVVAIPFTTLRERQSGGRRDHGLTRDAVGRRRWKESDAAAAAVGGSPDAAAAAGGRSPDAAAVDLVRCSRGCGRSFSVARWGG